MSYFSSSTRFSSLKLDLCSIWGHDQVFCFRSSAGDPYKYNTLPPLPAQRNLTPPPTLYPQQPVSVAESYSISRFNLTGSQVISNTARSKRMDINVWWSLALDLLCKESTFPWCWALLIWNSSCFACKPFDWFFSMAYIAVSFWVTVWS